LERLIEDSIFDLSNQNNINTYIADYTDNRTKRKIKLALIAIDYLQGLDIARKLAVDKNYRFDDLTFKSKAKASK
jgi:hypothetical protein